MKLKLIFVMTLLLVITSCSNDNEIETPQEVIITDKPSKISAAFPLLQATLVLAGYDNDVIYTFEYDSEGRVSKRNGILVEGNMMWPAYLEKSAYTKITYTGNTAIMKNYNASKPDERKFEFDNQGRIIKLIIPSATNITLEKHLKYSYNIAGKLVEVLTTFPNASYDPTNPNDYVLTYLEKFTYNSKGNLEKAITTEKHNNTDVYITKVVECDIFDLAPNPFHKLGVFENYFYFSLSNNNFNKMLTKMYKSGTLDITYDGAWTNQYNSDGSLKLFY